MKTLLAAALLLSALPAQALDGVTADFETGPLYIFQNDGRYGPGGTDFSAKDVGQQRNLVLSQRLSLELGLTPRQTLIFLYAPLELTTRAVLPNELRFKDVVFPAGTTVDHRYRFTGYRASYLYALVDSLRWRWSIGASLQVRDAAVEFTALEGSAHAIEPDIGLVFAVKTRLRFTPEPWLYAELDADGISSFGIANVKGALYDVALTLGLPLSSSVDLVFRLRGVGGGADVTDRNIYNWANFGAATAGVRVDLEEIASHLQRG